MIRDINMETKVKEKKIEEKSDKKALMMPVYDIEGKETKTLDLPQEIFGVKINNKQIAQYIRIYLINQRQGTASTKTRSEVVGSTRKIYKQKGTGKARHGDIKAPIFVGGGVTGGPKPRNFEANMNKKMRKQVILMALSLKASEKNIIGLEDSFVKIEPKTKVMADFLKKLSLLKTKILIVLTKLEKNNLNLALRNLPLVKVVQLDEINSFLLMKNTKLLLLESTLKNIKLRFEKKI